MEDEREHSTIRYITQLPLTRLEPADEFIRRGGVYIVPHRFMPYVLKVGCSVDIVRRMRTMSSKIYTKVGLKTPDLWSVPTLYIASLEGASVLYQMEQSLHRQLNRCHLAHEWFDRDAVLMMLRVWYPSSLQIISDFETAVKSLQTGWQVGES